nr:MAG TPA: PhTx neurotoxin family [Caudoviricetes sp.]
MLVALRSLEVQKAIRGDNQCCHGACRYGIKVFQ